MPKFICYNQNQPMLLPLNIKDCLPADHICFVINDVVDSLALSSIANSYSEDGRPAYNPRMLIKVMSYSYAKGIRSSRKIETLTYENLAIRYLAANQNPDHGTISLFRKDHLENLVDIFAQVVMLCNGLKMIDPTDVSIDGSIFKASAARKETYNLEDITKLKNKIKKMLRQAAELDQQEDEQCKTNKDGPNISAKLQDPKTRQVKIKQLQAKMRQLNKAEKAIAEKQVACQNNQEKKLTKNQTTNTTDTDANLLKLKIGNVYKPAYNGQIATSNQVVLGYDITDDNSDAHSLKPMVETTENNTKQQVKKAKLDSGYFSKQNIVYVNDKQIDAYIPDQRKAIEEHQEKNNKIPKYDRRNFSYDQDKDEFICPQNQRLPLVRTDQGTKKYIGANCSGCPVKAKCAKGKNRYISYDPELEQLKTTMRKKLNTKEGKAKYLERMSDVEPVFGNIIFNQKAGNFLCRGKPIVKIEFGLSCLAHNLVKITNWIKKEKKKLNELQLDTLMRLPATA